MDFCGGRFTVKTTTMIVIECIKRLWKFHEKMFVHRDIKPENFMIGSGKKAGEIYLIDFGLSKRFIDPKTNDHIKEKQIKFITGTARYISKRAHYKPHARRDDLESLGFLMIYFMKGRLPWEGKHVSGQKEDKEKVILEIKKTITIEELTEDLPNEYTKYMNYCRDLKFQ